MHRNCRMSSTFAAGLLRLWVVEDEDWKLLLRRTSIIPVDSSVSENTMESLEVRTAGMVSALCVLSGRL